MKARFLLNVLLVLIMVPSIAQVRSGDNVVIEENVNDDLYVAGGTVSINAPINGDLIAAGGTININDTITQDVLVAGGNIFVKGVVQDDIRCAGGTINIARDVVGDLVITGGSITIDKGVVISGDVLASGGEVVLNGRVNGQIKSASGSFTLNGVASNNVDARGAKIIINGMVEGDAVLAGNDIKIGENAKFSKTVRYWSGAESVDFHNSVSGNTATFDSSLEPDGKWHYLGFATFLMVVWYLGTALLFIILLQYCFQNTFRIAAGTIRDSSLKSLGLGVLFLLGVPIAIIIAFVTVIGIPLGLLALIGYGTILLLGTVIVSILAANWINNNYDQSWSNGRIMLVAFVLFIVLKLASLTPVVGPIIMFLMIVMGFGGILQNIRWKRNRKLALT